MIRPQEDATIGKVFFEAAQTWKDRPFLCVPANPRRGYHAAGWEITYAQAAKQVRDLMDLYQSAGYGLGHRVALLLENRPEHFLHKLALNALGACCVPVNPDYRASELMYLLQHSRPDLIVTIASRQSDLVTMQADVPSPIPLVTFESFGAGVPPSRRPGKTGAPSAATAASILYTSGTTGQPKGCVLSHYYELANGAWYATRGFLSTFKVGGDRLYNPLPLYHVNSGVFSFFCAMLTGNCQIQSDRFRPERWWPEIRESRATVVHYLGVIVPLLLGRLPGPEDRDHQVRFGLGAGVEPTLHARFEERFDFPLIEVWGMTEIVGALFDNEPTRQVGTRSFGRVREEGLEVRIVDDQDNDVPDGSPGQMLVRHSAATPRKRFFSEYFDDPEATSDAWRGGWFHTGDGVVRDEDGTIHFVDRLKNIIRRSGENIAAAEVEAVLQTHPMVKQVSVLALADELRDEEVLACVVLSREQGGYNEAVELFDYCNERLAYYKAPGWMIFLDELPTTGTQKIQKHRIFLKGSDPRTLTGMIDLRSRKKRSGS